MRRFRIAIAIVALSLTGCAYFNTLYNARQKFHEAEKATMAREAQQARQSNVSSTGATLATTSQRNPQEKDYEAVIEKCRTVMARYPTSRYVDDAMLLIARSLYRLERYDEAVAALDSLESRFPKTNLLGDAHFLKGKCLVAAERYAAASDVLSEYVDHYRKHHNRAEGLYLLCTSQMEQGLSDEAVATLHRLEKDHGRSDYRFRAQVEMAQILADKELYKKSLDVYRSLGESRIPESMRYDVWLGMAKVQEAVSDHAGALETLGQLKGLTLAPEQIAPVLLMTANAHAGEDSTDLAIREYRQVATKYSRGDYGAEADYRLAQIYEAMDSLETAQSFYQKVPTASSSSEFADDAIRRGSDIGRILKIQSTSGDNSPEAVALRTFSMAEVQLLQFNNTEKAITNYEKVVKQFGDTEYAPKAAYALGYIYGVVMSDTTKAREWYDVLRTRYPDSQQALLACGFYKGAPPAPPLASMIHFNKPKETAGDANKQPAVQPGAHNPAPPPPPAPVSAPPDSLRSPDSQRKPAPADSSR